MPIMRHRGDSERPRRLVRRGDAFDSDELDRDEIELEAVEPAAEIPDDEQTEPWARLAAAGEALARLRAYREQFPDEQEG